MAKRKIILGLMGVALGLAGCEVCEHESDKLKIRIGIYDSRAVAIAYAHSEWNEVGAKMAEMAAQIGPGFRECRLGRSELALRLDQFRPERLRVDGVQQVAFLFQLHSVVDYE